MKTPVIRGEWFRAPDRLVGGGPVGVGRPSVDHTGALTDLLVGEGGPVWSVGRSTDHTLHCSLGQCEPPRSVDHTLYRSLGHSCLNFT